jgi:hypothetical protein
MKVGLFQACTLYSNYGVAGQEASTRPEVARARAVVEAAATAIVEAAATAVVEAAAMAVVEAGVRRPW